MIRKTFAVVLIICLLLVLASSCFVRESENLSVVDSSVKIDFPDGIEFRLSAESDVAITDIRLYYQVERISFAEVTSEIYVDFEPGNKVNVDWMWEMRKTGGLPPGTGVKYWWAVQDAGGDMVTTGAERLLFNDERYSWRSLTQGKLTIYWYRGDDSFAQVLMDTAQQALVRLAEDTGAAPERPVEIYIYSDYQDLRGSMIFPQEWTGGVAFVRYGVIAIGIEPGNLDWGSRAMVHELTHLVIHQITYNPYGELPVWLDEGLAMYAEGEPEPFLEITLIVAVVNDELDSLRYLSSPFSAYSEESPYGGGSTVSYAQSYSIVKFLIDNYGREKMSALLENFRQGSDYDSVFIRVYGFDMDGLEELWRASLLEAMAPVK